MGLTDAPRGMRLHIGIFGRRNVGKSSLLNAITRQDVSIVSDFAGTTTDPVEKPMELLPLGPVLFIDTAGIDDVGVLGELRAKRTTQVFDRTDLGVLVTEAGSWGEYEDGILDEFLERKTPVVVVFNKADLVEHAGAGRASAGPRDHAGADRGQRRPRRARLPPGAARRGAARLHRQPHDPRRPRQLRRPRRARGARRQGGAARPPDPAAGAEHPRPHGQRRHGAGGQGARAQERPRQAQRGRPSWSSPTPRPSSRWPPTRRPTCR